MWARGLGPALVAAGLGEWTWGALKSSKKCPLAKCKNHFAQAAQELICASLAEWVFETEFSHKMRLLGPSWRVRVVWPLLGGAGSLPRACRGAASSPAPRLSRPSAPLGFRPGPGGHAGLWFLPNSPHGGDGRHPVFQNGTDEPLPAPGHSLSAALFHLPAGPRSRHVRNRRREDLHSAREAPETQAAERREGGFALIASGRSLGQKHPSSPACWAT